MLVVSLDVIVPDKLPDCFAKRCFPEQGKVILAGLLDDPHKSLGIGVTTNIGWKKGLREHR